MTATYQIGIFDSGLGGLTVFREVADQLPSATLLYFGDTARVPYGIKSREIVTQYSLEIARFLVAKQIQALVVACNSASACALPALQAAHKIPIFGVIEPGAKRAVAATRNGRIGVIGTEATIRSEAYHQWLKKMQPDCQVFAQACSLLVPLVEEGWLEEAETQAIVRRYLAPLMKNGVDTLILGCTHYPLLKPMIQEVMGPEVRLVDSAEEVARALRAVIPAKALPTGSHQCYVTDAPERFQQVGSRFLSGMTFPPVEKILL